MSRFEGDFAIDDQDALLAAGRWIARKNKVLGGRPGRTALRELERALTLLPRRRLISGGLCENSGEVCAMGAWLFRKFVDDGMTPRAAWKRLRASRAKSNEFQQEELVATIEAGHAVLGITRTLAEVVAWMNDEEFGLFTHTTPEVLYSRMLEWVRRAMALPEGEVPVTPRGSFP